MTIRLDTLINNVINGTCFDRFYKMSEGAQVDTALKTVGVAVVADIIGSALPGLGKAGKALFSGMAALGAFAYMTTSYGAANYMRDHMGGFVNNVRKHI